jgi:hypothetical protein
MKVCLELNIICKKVEDKIQYLKEYLLCEVDVMFEEDIKKIMNI